LCVVAKVVLVSTALSTEMVDVKLILFPTDFSTLSRRARDWVVKLAEAFGAKVILLHSIEPLQVPDSEVDEEIRTFYEGLRREVEAKMEGERAVFMERGIEVESRVELGVRWVVINTLAEEMDVDLIVIGSHGIRTESGRPSIGTTSHKVSLSSPRPVLVVRYED